MQNTVLFFGGSSDERLVSTASAQNLCQQYGFTKIWFLTKSGGVHEIQKTDLLQHADAFTQEFSPKAGTQIASGLKEAMPLLKNHVVFMGFHGTEGENGEMQALLEEFRIPFTGSGSLASRDCFDKVRAKKTVAAAGIKTTDELSVNPKSAESFEALRAFFKRHSKIVLKPTANGSSIGLFIVDSESILENAIKEISKKPETPYLAEKFIVGRECTIGILQTPQGHQALPASEVIMQSGRNFDYSGKYLGQGSTEITPAEVKPEQMKALQEVSMKAHKALNCYGYTRTDVILCANDEIIYLETNTLPGLTKASFIPQQLAEAKINMTDFIELQLRWALERYN
ncbi:D-alanine--D-alanine ligase family protein [Bdellovibrio sp. BCCA]|uniref:D-alanine--D-alanine ligase family protein n=1 Tax=Bdellovibrio sp. BCCA TaxID=3136281 RepID=UPI0030F125DC